MNDEPHETHDLEARAASLEKQLTDMEASTTARLIQAELKAEAVRAGMVDLDGLKLVDTAGLVLSAQGEVEGAASLMQRLRRSKPWLFGAESSSSLATAPPAQPPAAKVATAMTHVEWQAARAELLKRR